MYLGAITVATLRELEARLSTLLAGTAGHDVLCDVGCLPIDDASVIDALARLQLTAHRYGARIVLANVPPQLHDLLELAGLCDIVGACPEPPAGSVVEAERQAEEREPALGIEEEGDAADPVT